MINEQEDWDKEIDLEEQSDLYEHYRFEIDKGQTLIRIDKYLTSRIENASRNRIQLAIDAGFVLVNDIAVKASYKVKPYDKIVIVLPYERRITEIIAQDIPINIIYEDQDLIVIDKAAGMVVHPGHGNYTHTLVNAIAFHLQKTVGKFDQEDERAGLVHRIDKNTSGLLVVAKNELAHSRLAKQFFDRTILRHYIALVWGNIKEEEGTITGNIGRNLKDRLKMSVFPDGNHGKHAVTHYKLLENLTYVSLVECHLETGRTHQIRVHMEYIGHPLFNDERYGGDKILRGTHFSKYKQFVENCFSLLPGQALHAASLGFIHPTTGKEMLFKSPLPSAFNSLIEKWRNYLSSRDL